MTAVATRSRELAAVRRDAADCRRCDLYRHATQTVFGEGRPDAPLMLVGEQPGDVEDEEGRPFVGPAGLLLREILTEIGVDERRLYVTNAVKHFKWKPKGARRIHDKPNWTEIRACDHWLRLELALVRPKLVVCLGATATQALLGREARVTALRGRVVDVPRARGACPRHDPPFGGPTGGRAASRDAQPSSYRTWRSPVTPSAHPTHCATRWSEPESVGRGGRPGGDRAVRALPRRAASVAAHFPHPAFSKPLTATVVTDARGVERAGSGYHPASSERGEEQWA